MLQTVNRLSLILTLNNYCLDLSLLKEYDAEPLLNCCVSLEARKIPKSSYTGCPEIQKELIQDERFFYIFAKMADLKISKEIIDSLLGELHNRGESVLDYPHKQLLSGMAVIAHHREVFYDYLRCFGYLPTDRAQKSVIVNNLSIYQSLGETPVAELPEPERLLLMEPFFETDLIPSDPLNRALTMLTQQPALLELVRYLYENKLDTSLEIEHYESISLTPGAILGKLKALYRLLGKNTTIMKKLLKLWLKNNCLLYDLEVLSEKLKGMDAEQLEDVFDTRSSYIGLIYGSRINNIPLTEVSEYQEDILVYAITNKKHSFLRLVEGDFDAFLQIGPRSILFHRDFYARYVNLSSLSAKNLAECGNMIVSEMCFDALDQNRAYTFEEIKALYGQPAQYLSLYTRLGIPRVDGRLIVLRQLIKQNLLAEVTDEAEIERLAEMLSRKPLSAWREQDFAHIAGLKPEDALGLLIRHTEIGKFIPQMKSWMDARITLRNWAGAQNYNSITEMEGDIIKIDSAWRELVQSLELGEQFLRHNQDRVIEFICQNGAYIAGTYYKNLYNGQRESFKRIIKAELMGEFNTLKYFADDLSKELDHPIHKTQKSVWMENAEQIADNITVRECDDFYSSMLLGTVPQRTCLSYIDGAYKECLLSAFDSNKKVLYAYVNGKAAARAIIRLTKGRFGNGDSHEETPSLSFVDVEALSDAEAAPVGNHVKERLTLFLEKTYFSGISEQTQKRVMDHFIALMEQKAMQMGAMMVLSNTYGGCNLEEYTRTSFNIYISKSKAGSQYLDSLNGSTTVSDEGGYKSNSFYIHKADIKGGFSCAK